MPAKFTAAYADIVNNKFAFMLPNGGVKECLLVRRFVEEFCTVNDVVTVGEWAANMGILTVKTLFSKQTFSTMGFPNVSLAEKVKIIHELATGMYRRDLTIDSKTK